MRRTNRVEPVNAGNDANDLARATMTTTTRMEFVRRVQVLPMEQAVAQLHGDLNQSLAGEATISPRIWTGMQRPATPIAIRGTRRAIWVIGCLFITVGLLALFALIVGLTIAFGTTNAIGESGIERYDVGDLHYGVDNVDSEKFPSNTYLSNDNKIAVQKYFADQFINESGYRGLFIDGVLVQQQSGSSRRRRDASCDAIFVVRNIQVYFDYCSTCAGSRNLALRRALSNITAFQQPLELLLNSAGQAKVATEICSVPTMSRLIIPVQLSILQAERINSSLIHTTTTTYSPTTVTQTTSSTYTSSIRRSSGRSTSVLTSRGVTTQKVTSMRKITTTTTTTTVAPIETTMADDTTTGIHTVTSAGVTDSILTTESTVTERVTMQQTDVPTTRSEIDTTTAEQSDDVVTTEEVESTSPSSSSSSTEGPEDSTYTMELTSFSTDTATVDTDTTSAYEEMISTSTLDLVKNITTTDETVTTSIDNSTEMTDTTTLDLSTVNDTTTESDSLETTTNIAQTDLETNSTLEMLSTTVFDDNSTTYEDVTDLTTEMESSTIYSYTEETTSLPEHVPTTMKPTTSYSRLTSKKIVPYKPSLSTSGRRYTSAQQTTPSAITMSSGKPGRTRKQTYYSTLFTSPMITSTNTYRLTTDKRRGRLTTASASITSAKAGRTQKQTYYSTATTSVTAPSTNTYRPTVDKRQGRLTTVATPVTSIKPGRTQKQTYYSALLTSPAITSANTYRQTTDKRRGRLTTAGASITSAKAGRTPKQTYYSTLFTSPIVTSTINYQSTTNKRRGRWTTAKTSFATTGQTNTRVYTTVTLPVTTATRQRGRSKATIGTSKQTTYYPTTMTTTYKTTVLPTTTTTQDYTSIASTEIIVTDSTSATGTNTELPIDLEQTSTASNEELSTESLSLEDLASTDGTYTTTPKISTTTTKIVSTSGMINTLSLLDNTTEEQRLHSLIFTTTTTTTISFTNAYIESSSITSASTADVSRRSTELLNTLFDISASTVRSSKISTEDHSSYSNSELYERPTAFTAVNSENDQNSVTASHTIIQSTTESLFFADPSTTGTSSTSLQSSTMAYSASHSSTGIVSLASSESSAQKSSTSTISAIETNTVPVNSISRSDLFTYEFETTTDLITNSHLLTHITNAVINDYASLTTNIDQTSSSTIHSLTSDIFQDKQTTGQISTASLTTVDSSKSSPPTSPPTNDVHLETNIITTDGYHLDSISTQSISETSKDLTVDNDLPTVVEQHSTPAHHSSSSNIENSDKMTTGNNYPTVSERTIENSNTNTMKAVEQTSDIILTTINIDDNFLISDTSLVSVSTDRSIQASVLATSSAISSITTPLTNDIDNIPHTTVTDTSRNTSIVPDDSKTDLTTADNTIATSPTSLFPSTNLPNDSSSKESSTVYIDAITSKANNDISTATMIITTANEASTPTKKSSSVDATTGTAESIINHSVTAVPTDADAALMTTVDSSAKTSPLSRPQSTDSQDEATSTETSSLTTNTSTVFNEINPIPFSTIEENGIQSSTAHVDDATAINDASSHHEKLFSTDSTVLSVKSTTHSSSTSTATDHENIAVTTDFKSTDLSNMSSSTQPSTITPSTTEATSTTREHTTTPSSTIHIQDVTTQKEATSLHGESSSRGSTVIVVQSTTELSPISYLTDAKGAMLRTMDIRSTSAVTTNSESTDLFITTRTDIGTSSEAASATPSTTDESSAIRSSTAHAHDTTSRNDGSSHPEKIFSTDSTVVPVKSTTGSSTSPSNDNEDIPVTTDNHSTDLSNRATSAGTPTVTRTSSEAASATSSTTEESSAIRSSTAHVDDTTAINQASSHYEKLFSTDSTVVPVKSTTDSSSTRTASDNEDIAVTAHFQSSDLPSTPTSAETSTVTRTSNEAASTTRENLTTESSTIHIQDVTTENDAVSLHRESSSIDSTVNVVQTTTERSPASYLTDAKDAMLRTTDIRSASAVTTNSESTDLSVTTRTDIGTSSEAAAAAPSTREEDMPIRSSTAHIDDTTPMNHASSHHEKLFAIDSTVVSVRSTTDSSSARIANDNENIAVTTDFKSSDLPNTTTSAETSTATRSSTAAATTTRESLAIQSTIIQIRDVTTQNDATSLHQESSSIDSTVVMVQTTTERSATSHSTDSKDPMLRTTDIRSTSAVTTNLESTDLFITTRTDIGTSSETGSATPFTTQERMAVEPSTAHVDDTTLVNHASSHHEKLFSDDSTVVPVKSTAHPSTTSTANDNEDTAVTANFRPTDVPNMSSSTQTSTVTRTGSEAASATSSTTAEQIPVRSSTAHIDDTTAINHASSHDDKLFSTDYSDLPVKSTPHSASTLAPDHNDDAAVTSDSKSTDLPDRLSSAQKSTVTQSTTEAVSATSSTTKEPIAILSSTAHIDDTTPVNDASSNHQKLSYTDSTVLPVKSTTDSSSTPTINDNEDLAVTTHFQSSDLPSISSSTQTSTVTRSTTEATSTTRESFAIQSSTIHIQPETTQNDATSLREESSSIDSTVNVVQTTTERSPTSNSTPDMDAMVITTDVRSTDAATSKSADLSITTRTDIRISSETASVTPSTTEERIPIRSSTADIDDTTAISDASSHHEKLFAIDSTVVSVRSTTDSSSVRTANDNENIAVTADFKSSDLPNTRTSLETSTVTPSTTEAASTTRESFSIQSTTIHIQDVTTQNDATSLHGESSSIDSTVVMVQTTTQRSLTSYLTDVKDAMLRTTDIRSASGVTTNSESTDLSITTRTDIGTSSETVAAVPSSTQEHMAIQSSTKHVDDTTLVNQASSRDERPFSTDYTVLPVESTTYSSSTSPSNDSEDTALTSNFQSIDLPNTSSSTQTSTVTRSTTEAASATSSTTEESSAIRSSTAHIDDTTAINQASSHYEKLFFTDSTVVPVKSTTDSSSTRTASDNEDIAVTAHFQSSDLPSTPTSAETSTVTRTSNEAASTTRENLTTESSTIHIQDVTTENDAVSLHGESSSIDSTTIIAPSAAESSTSSDSNDFSISPSISADTKESIFTTSSIGRFRSVGISDTTSSTESSVKGGHTSETTSTILSIVEAVTTVSPLTTDFDVTTPSWNNETNVFSTGGITIALQSTNGGLAVSNFTDMSTLEPVSAENDNNTFDETSVVPEERRVYLSSESVSESTNLPSELRPAESSVTAQPSSEAVTEIGSTKISTTEPDIHIRSSILHVDAVTSKASSGTFDTTTLITVVDDEASRTENLFSTAPTVSELTENKHTVLTTVTSTLDDVLTISDKSGADLSTGSRTTVRTGSATTHETASVRMPTTEENTSIQPSTTHINAIVPDASNETSATTVLTTIMHNASSVSTSTFNEDSVEKQSTTERSTLSDSSEFDTIPSTTVTHILDRSSTAHNTIASSSSFLSLSIDQLNILSSTESSTFEVEKTASHANNEPSTTTILLTTTTDDTSSVTDRREHDLLTVHDTIITSSTYHSHSTKMPDTFSETDPTKLSTTRVDTSSVQEKMYSIGPTSILAQSTSEFLTVSDSIGTSQIMKSNPTLLADHSTRERSMSTNSIIDSTSTTLDKEESTSTVGISSHQSNANNFQHSTTYLTQQDVFSTISASFTPINADSVTLSEETSVNLDLTTDLHNKQATLPSTQNHMYSTTEKISPTSVSTDSDPSLADAKTSLSLNISQSTEMDHTTMKAKSSTASQIDDETTTSSKIEQISTSTATTSSLLAVLTSNYQFNPDFTTKNEIRSISLTDSQQTDAPAKSSTGSTSFNSIQSTTNSSNGTLPTPTTRTEQTSSTIASSTDILNTTLTSP
ncbi:unnamed protein product [Adineta ricciae]|uniref:Uncharacterized protein n=1 Tax=Adineta ricciae TaxID=249248 RepID=A0A813Q9Y4_ADIRI|nr:unnamed protein product [Adineta ricciae]CAF1096996.1 unnamed protein product [Adineta ricciae]